MYSLRRNRNGDVGIGAHRIGGGDGGGVGGTMVDGGQWARWVVVNNPGEHTSSLREGDSDRGRQEAALDGQRAAMAWAEVRAVRYLL